MGSKREKTLPRQMRKVILVICEGETEENYVALLRKWCKSPIRVISRVEGNKITPSLVESRIRELKISPHDNVQAYLMYDMDVEAVNARLRECKAGLLLSNPCFEFWLLLHAKDHKSAINADSVIKELKNSAVVWKSYNKAAFSDTQRAFLKDNTGIAMERAMRLKEFENPSTGIYKLILKLAESKSGN